MSIAAKFLKYLVFAIMSVFVLPLLMFVAGNFPATEWSNAGNLIHPLVQLILAMLLATGLTYGFGRMLEMRRSRW
jgi:hypothetical protein